MQSGGGHIWRFLAVDARLAGNEGGQLTSLKLLLLVALSLGLWLVAGFVMLRIAHADVTTAAGGPGVVEGLR